jgi:ribosomal protein S18 acetylase RimI-like enzyme
MIEIVRARATDADVVAPLFDAYRRFYGQAPDLATARSFLSDRLTDGTSIIFLARLDGEAAGFIQLYPGFSSVRAARILVLNDLYVTTAARGCGVADQLLAESESYAARSGAIRLTLQTAVANAPARALYERRGWRLDQEFLTYDFAVSPTEPPPAG